MLRGFICPDGETVGLSECLGGDCRLGFRCLTLPTLAKIASERKRSVVLSTTQALNGTMYEFLRATKGYAIDPKSKAYSLHGIVHHEELATWARRLNADPKKFKLIVETSLTSDDRNVFDLLEAEMEDGREEYNFVLTDYKTWGSYKVAKTFGITKVDTGHVEFYTDAAGKTRSRRVYTFQEQPENADTFDLDMQMNRYRLLLQSLGINVSRMQVQITVRDGGLQVANQRGVTELMYLRLVQEVADSKVREYFEYKQAQYEKALADGDWTEPCTDYECWEGMRCRRYCEVAQFCVKGRMERERAA